MNRVLTLLIVSALLIQYAACKSRQELTTNIKTDSSMNNLEIEKWSKALLHLDGRTSSSAPAIDEVRDKFRKGEITEQEYEIISDEVFNRYRYLGTGVYFANNRNHYIITARHVIEDTSTWHREGTSWDKAFDEIMIVQRGHSSDQLQFPKGYPIIRGLNAGVTDEHPFIFSPKDDDIGIINLSATPSGQYVIEYLQQNGYVPITWNDIDTICHLKVGEQIFAVGFPGNHSFERSRLPEAYRHVLSDLVSTPVISEGQIHNNVSNENYILGDVFVMGGNSGGPLIAGNKLVGITLAFGATDHKLPSSGSFSFYRRRVSIFRKATILPSLLKMLDDRQHRRFPF